MAAAAFVWTRVDLAVSIVRYEVERRLVPANAVALDAGRLAAGAEQQWDAAAVDRTWDAFGGAASATRRSPALRLSAPHELFAIAITLPPSPPAQPAVLLWSSQATMTTADFARNRRDIVASAGERVLLWRSDALQSAGDAPIRHLFLYVPNGQPVARHVQHLAVIERRALGAAGAHGPVRLSLSGESREVYVTKGATAVSYEIDATRFGAVAFGAYASGAAPVSVRVALTDDGGREPLFDQSISANAWHDFTVPLTRSGRVTLAFEATAADAVVHWSVPRLLRPDDALEEPNVVVYVVDALRADHLGAYGASNARTPAIDQLARDGIVFERAYAPSSWTKPSVTTLLTSLYPATHGLGSRYYTDALPSSVVTLQDALAADGYATAQFSANPFTASVSNLDDGFDAASSLQSWAGDGAPGAANAAAVHSRALRWIEANRSQRFFIYIQAVDTHPPFSVAGATPQDAYRASLASVDAEIAALQRHLVSAGLWHNTLLIITADHGEAFGEHGRDGHGQSVYDEEIRVPLILHWPARLTPARMQEPVHLVDLMPTVLALAGSPAPASLQGATLVPAPVAPSPVIVSRSVYSEDVNSPLADRTEMHAVVDGSWKLIRFGDPAGQRPLELYQIDADAGERTNLAQVEPARVRLLTAVLDRWLEQQRQARAQFAAQHQAGAGAARQPPSRELLDQLRSLGYVR